MSAHRRTSPDDSTPPIWTGRSRLQRVLAGAFGALLGSLISLLLGLALGTHAWYVYVPIAVVALLCFLGVDAAVAGVVRFIGALLRIG
jgi:hypothetical protein